MEWSLRRLCKRSRSLLSEFERRASGALCGEKIYRGTSGTAWRGLRVVLRSRRIRARVPWCTVHRTVQQMSTGTREGLPVLVIVVAEDWYFVSHRLSLARAARAAGYHVVIASRFSSHADALRAEGFELFPLRLRRRAKSVRDELASIIELRRLYQRLQPMIAHHVALKPVVFGTIASWGLRKVKVVNAIAGLGYVASSRRLGARVRRALMVPALRRLLSRPASVILVQNELDRAKLLVGGVLDPARIVLLRGAGVDLTEFTPQPESDGPPVVLYAGRFLWDKGVGDFVEAARRLRTEGRVARFVLVGSPDHDSPGTILAHQVVEWQAEGVIEYWGRRTDMPSVFAQSGVVCLPSRYGEGVPKVLLEAAACGRAVVTTDWPGCRDVVRPDETGILVPPNDVDALTIALRGLLADPERRRRYGAAGRKLAEREFDVRGVVAETLRCYSRLLQY